MLPLKTHFSSNKNLKKSWKLCSTREQTEHMVFPSESDYTGTVKLVTWTYRFTKGREASRILDTGPYNTVGDCMVALHSGLKGSIT